MAPKKISKKVLILVLLPVVLLISAFLVLYYFNENYFLGPLGWYSGVFNKGEVNEALKQKPILIFPKEKTAENEINLFTSELKSINGVTDVIYVSKEAAYKEYLEFHKNEPIIIELAPANGFPARVEVYLNSKFSINDQVVIQDNVYNLAKQKPYVDEVIKTKYDIEQRLKNNFK